jgi:hypothetical protein
MPIIEGGAVTIDVLDPAENILDTRSTSNKIQTAAISPEEPEIEEGVFFFSVLFPDQTTQVHARSDDAEAVLNPISRSVRAPIRRLSDSAFKRAAMGRRKAINNKLDAVDKMVKNSQFQAAEHKMSDDIRDKLEKWLTEGYRVSALQLSKSELLTRVDEMIERLRKIDEGSK